MKRLILFVVFLAVSINSEAAKMSSYTNNTNPNEDVYFIGVDPNDLSQTSNGSNYRYSLSSILGSGLLDFNVNSLTVSGTGDSWLELENNTTFTDSLVGKYGLRFYNGVLQQIIDGTASSIGSGGSTPTIQADDPTSASATGWYLATSSGDTFYKSDDGLFNVSSGTYTADPSVPTLTSLTIPSAGTTATAVFSEAMTVGAGGNGGWTLNTPTNAMTYTSGSGTDTIVFNLAATILDSDTPTVSYTQPGNGWETNDDQYDLATISGASVTNNSTQVSGCAGGSDGYIGRSDFGGYTTGCVGTCTTNYLYYSKFVVETDPSQEDGAVTAGHWNTQFLNASTRAGIWNSSGNLVVGTAEQEGNDSDPNTYNASVSETCLAAGTYYGGIWVEGDAWANAATSGYDAGQWTRVVEMPVFGNIGSDPETAGTVHAANAEVAVWFNNTAGR